MKMLINKWHNPQKVGWYCQLLFKRGERQMTDNGNDRCVYCGNDSGVPHGTPIAERKNYVQGGGQLCSNCYLKLYIKGRTGVTFLSSDKMKTLVQMCKEADNR